MDIEDRLKEFDEGLDKLGDAEIQFALKYPTETLVDYVLDNLSPDQTNDLLEKFKANIILKNRAGFVEMVVAKHGITTFEQYDAHCKKYGDRNIL